MRTLDEWSRSYTFKADRIVLTRDNGWFRFTWMQITMFRLNSKFAFVRNTIRYIAAWSAMRACEISINRQELQRLRFRSIDPPVSILTSYRMEQQKFHGKQNFIGDLRAIARIRRFYIRVMLFSCFRRIIVFLKYRSTSREWAWWDLARKCHVCVRAGTCV